MSENSSIEPIPVRYDSEECVIRLQQDITAQSIFSLCEEIDFAIDYYQYDKISIEIDSVGGDTSYLEYYFLKLNGWVSRGISIRTIGLTIAASASAYILTCGSPGLRTSYPATRIVFHYGTAGISSGKTLTRLELDRRSKRLGDIDSQFEGRVVNHVLSVIQTNSYRQYPIDPQILSSSAITGEDIREMWEQIGVHQHQIDHNDLLKTVDIVREVVGSVHSSGQELTPNVALSLLFIDSIVLPSVETVKV